MCAWFVQACTRQSLSPLALQLGDGSACSGCQGLVLAGLTEHAPPLGYRQGLCTLIAPTPLLRCMGCFVCVCAQPYRGTEELPYVLMQMPPRCLPSPAPALSPSGSYLQLCDSSEATTHPVEGNATYSWRVAPSCHPPTLLVLVTCRLGMKRYDIEELETHTNILRVDITRTDQTLCSGAQ